MQVGRVKGRRKEISIKDNARLFYDFLCGAKFTGTLASWDQGPPSGALGTRDVRMMACLHTQAYKGKYAHLNPNDQLNLVTS